MRMKPSRHAFLKRYHQAMHAQGLLRKNDGVNDGENDGVSAKRKDDHDSVEDQSTQLAPGALAAVRGELRPDEPHQGLRGAHFRGSQHQD